jgi:crossover junction endodeoxyribonuclease RusA
MPPLLSVTLPLAPSINAQYYTHEGRHVLTPWSRRYRAAVEQRVRHLEWQGRLDSAHAQRGHLSLFLRYYFETPLRRDLDSGLKITQDAITAGLGVDDSRVVDVHLVKQIDPLRPRVEAEVEVIEGWDWNAEPDAPWCPIALTLPLPPSINDQYVIVRGRRHRSAELRRFRKAVDEIVRAAGAPEQIPPALRRSGRPGYLSVFADFYFARRQRRDVDSGLKALLDAVCAPLAVNDARVVDIHITRRIDDANPRTALQIDVLEDWAFDKQYVAL